MADAAWRLFASLTSWLRQTRDNRLGGRRECVEVGRLTAIFVADQAGAPMRFCRAATAIVDAGLAEDRYARDEGFWRLTDGCQVTLIHSEDLARAERRYGLPLDAGQHRRNLVVSGLARAELRGRRIGIGDALFEWHRVRPPCGYLDRVSGKGTAKALGRRSGHCLRVRKAGLIRVGDRVCVLPS